MNSLKDMQKSLRGSNIAAVRSESSEFSDLNRRLINTIELMSRSAKQMGELQVQELLTSEVMINDNQVPDRSQSWPKLRKKAKRCLIC